MGENGGVLATRLTIVQSGEPRWLERPDKRASLENKASLGNPLAHSTAVETSWHKAATPGWAGRRVPVRASRLPRRAGPVSPYLILPKACILGEFPGLASGRSGPVHLRPGRGIASHVPPARGGRDERRRRRPSSRAHSPPRVADARRYKAVTPIRAVRDYTILGPTIRNAPCRHMLVVTRFIGSKRSRLAWDQMNAATTNGGVAWQRVMHACS